MTEIPITKRNYLLCSNKLCGIYNTQEIMKLNYLDFLPLQMLQGNLIK